MLTRDASNNNYIIKFDQLNKFASISESAVKVVSINMIFFTSPVNSQSEPFFPLLIESEVTPLDVNSPLAFNIPLADHNMNLFRKYNAFIYRSCLLLLDQNEQIVQYSVTV